MVAWNPDNTTGWMQFAPLYFNGSTPFGIGNVFMTYSYRKNVGPTLNWIQIAEDYVVCVLDTRMGEFSGWMGSHGYDFSWNGQPYWSHIGYSSDLGGGQFPSFENLCSFDFDFPPFVIDPWDGLDMEHHASIQTGDSGGPFFGWWPGEPWPRAVSVQSAQDNNPAGPNWAGGGDPMINLIIQARSDFP